MSTNFHPDCQIVQIIKKHTDPIHKSLKNENLSFYNEAMEVVNQKTPEEKKEEMKKLRLKEVQVLYRVNFYSVAVNEYVEGLKATTAKSEVKKVKRRWLKTLFAYDDKCADPDFDDFIWKESLETGLFNFARMTLQKEFYEQEINQKFPSMSAKMKDRMVMTLVMGDF